MKARIRFPAALAALGLPVALLAALAGFFSQQSPVRAQEAKTSALSVLDALPAETTVVLRLKNAADLRMWRNW